MFNYASRGISNRGYYIVKFEAWCFFIKLSVLKNKIFLVFFLPRRTDFFNLFLVVEFIDRRSIFLISKINVFQ